MALYSSPQVSKLELFNTLLQYHIKHNSSFRKTWNKHFTDVLYESTVVASNKSCYCESLSSQFASRRIDNNSSKRPKTVWVSVTENDSYTYIKLVLTFS